MADSEQRYSLSFTSIGTRRPETAKVARAYVDCLDWAEVRRRIVEDNIISLNKDSTRKRVGSELIKRLRMLDADEVTFLADAVDDDQLAHDVGRHLSRLSRPAFVFDRCCRCALCQDGARRASNGMGRLY